MKKLLLIGVILSMCGCATFDKHINSERLLVQIGTMKVIEAGDSAAARAVRADKIVSIASEAKTWLNTEGVTVDLLKSRVYERINSLDLPPSDRLLATLLVDTVVDELQSRVVGGVKMPVPPEQLFYQVNAVLGWVVDAAKVYQ